MRIRGLTLDSSRIRGPILVSSRIRGLTFSLSFFLFLVLSACCGESGRPVLPEASVFEKLSKSAVILRVHRIDRGPESVSYGSGTVIGRHGGHLFVLTAAHLFGDLPNPEILLCAVGEPGEGLDITARLANIDHNLDLALVAVPEVPELNKREPIPIAKNPPLLFHYLYQMSSPYRMPHTASRSLLTRRTEKAWYLYGWAYPGASGGTLANERAELVGVVTAVTPGDESVKYTPSVWLAVPLHHIQLFLREYDFITGNRK